MPKTKPVPFSRVVDALLDDQTPFPPRFLHRLSDLSPEDATTLIKAWPNISSPRRAALVVAVAATLLPARYATRIDPVEAMRTE